MRSRQAAGGEPVGCPGGPEPQDAALPIGKGTGTRWMCEGKG